MARYRILGTRNLRTPMGRMISVLCCVLLLANSVAPAIAATVQNKRNHVIKPGPKVPVMKGVPHMDLSKQGIVPKANLRSISKLDDDGTLKEHVYPTDIVNWRQAAATPGNSIAKADALVWLGEEALAGREEPVEAATLFNKALAAAP